MAKILIVDDEKIITMTLKKLLEKEGYEVTIANSGFEAVNYAKRDDFQLIIADIRMPGIDGIETIKKIFDNKKKSPVIFITGYADEDALKRAEELGYTSYIYKPFDLKVFLQKIKEAIA